MSRATLSTLNLNETNLPTLLWNVRLESSEGVQKTNSRIGSLCIGGPELGESSCMWFNAARLHTRLCKKYSNWDKISSISNLSFAFCRSISWVLGSGWERTSWPFGNKGILIYLKVLSSYRLVVQRIFPNLLIGGDNADLLCITLIFNQTRCNRARWCCLKYRVEREAFPNEK